jgi:hypothetical protein
MAPGCVRVEQPSGTYVLIVLSHVLEHVPSPRDLILQGYDCADDAGVLSLEVPSEASLYGPRPRIETVRRIREEWHEHINFFDEVSLAHLVVSTGGTVMTAETLESDVGLIVCMIVGAPAT